MSKDQYEPNGADVATPLEGLTLDPMSRTLELDVEAYRHFLEGAGLTPDQEREVIEALWGVIVGFVELGFGVHPAQQVAEDKLKDIENITPQAGTDRVQYEHSTQENAIETQRESEDS
ncbi:MAG: hypothetical protein ROR55_17835 [Devosia sp.]